MSFQNTFTPLAPLVPGTIGINIAPYSTPSPVLFKEKLYIFYNGRGNDGIWYTTTDSSGKFTPIVNISSTATGMHVARNTGPCAVVYNDIIYVFFSGRGKNGIWFCTNDGTNDVWTQPRSVLQLIGASTSFRPDTSPSAAVYHGVLYLIWIAPGTNGALPCATFDGKTWQQLPMPYMGISVAAQSSASLVTFNNTLYIVYNGSGNDGTWFVRFSAGTWLPTVPVQNLIGLQAFLPSTSPAAAVWGDRLCLMWSGVGNDGLFYTLTDGTSWSPQRYIGLDPLTGTSGAMIVYRHRPWVLVARNADDHLWANFGTTYTLDNNTNLPRADFPSLSNAITNGTYFSIYSFDHTLYQVFAKKFGAYLSTPFPPNLGQLLDFFGSNGASPVTASAALTFHAMLTAMLQRPNDYTISVTTDAKSQSFVVSFTVNLFK